MPTFAPMFKKALQFVFFLGLGVTILALVFRSQDAAFKEDCRLKGIPDADCSLLDKLWHDFSTVHLGWIAAVMAAFTLSNLFRALRWQLLIEPLGHRAGLGNSFWSILLGYFANLGLPRMGEVVRAGALARNERIPMEKVMGTLVVDRLMDVICLGLVVGLAFVFEGETLLRFITQNSSGQRGGGLLRNPWVLSFLALVLAGGFAAYLHRDKLRQLPIAQKMLGILTGFWEAMPGSYHVTYKADEYIHVFEGKFTLTEDGTGNTAQFGAGDTLHIAAGFTGVWKTEEKIRKTFAIRIA